MSAHGMCGSIFTVMAFALCTQPTRATAGLVDIVEFHHAAFDHYFVTADPVEIGKLDSGQTTGWQRTGLTFKGLDAGDTSPGARPVCRFYGLPSAGLDSHFYSASATECDEVKIKFPLAWLYESGNVFGIYLPDLTSGQCPANTIPVYRSWNARSDSNHRYTTSTAVHDAMVAGGAIAEGYGPPPRPVAMCAPVPANVAPPSCVLLASSLAAQTGATVLLSANCSGSPTAYNWTGCTSSGPQCTATSAAPGTVAYSVVAINAYGTSAPSSVQVAWSLPPPPAPPVAPPTCTIAVTAQSPTPTVGSMAVLEAWCSGDVTAYQWTNCASGTRICRVWGAAAGLQTYQLVAVNAGGSSVPVTANVNWTATPVPPPGLCAQEPSLLFSEVGSAHETVHSAYSESPGFAWDGAWVVRFTVPATAHAGQTGFGTAAEYDGPPTFREVTISTSACDFRAADPTGTNGPLARTYGMTPILYFDIRALTPGSTGLAPGGTYYLNIRNRNGDGTVSCSATQARCDALAAVRLPR